MTGVGRRTEGVGGAAAFLALAFARRSWFFDLSFRPAETPFATGAVVMTVAIEKSKNMVVEQLAEAMAESRRQEVTRHG